MPKNPRFAYKSTPQGWVVNVPASLSDTGRRRRRYFPSRDKAKAECQRLRELYQERKVSVADIRHALAEDATAAAGILDRFGVTLTQAARFYESQHDARAKAPTLSDAWDAAIARRPNHRARTLADYRAWKRALPAWLMRMNVHDLDPRDLEKALNETTSGSTRWRTGLRYVSAVLGDCVKAGEVSENVAKRVHVARKRENHDEVSIYTPAELEALFAACKTYPHGADRHCKECLPAFAIMAFAGVRPDEVAKLRWADIHPDAGVIRIGAGVAKKARRRNVRLHPTLEEWLQRVPESERKGKVVPARWRYKAARVRKEAGIDGHEKQDALRHSFGTYLLATENDLDALGADMGHEHIRVYLEHYNRPVSKKEALAYWRVLPKGAKKPKTLRIA